MKGSSSFLPVILAAVISASIGFMLSIKFSSERDPAPVTVPVSRVDNTKVGTMAPQFSLRELGGKTRNWSQWEGQIVLVNLWATWCPPCVRELPALSEMHVRLNGDGFQVLAIADDRPEAVKSFLSVRPVEMPVLMIGKQARKLSLAYGNTGGVLPYSVLVDRKGIIRHRYLGALKMGQLEADVKRLLAE